MTRGAVFMLLTCSGLASGSPLTTSATVALVPHFQKPPGEQLLHWIAPMIAEVFRPAGLSVEWYQDRDLSPPNAARTLDVWFRGDCRPMAAREVWNSRSQSDRLGWVHSRNGRIDDDIVVDCARVLQ